MNVPQDLFYTKSHEWVRIDGDVATIGITDHAQSELGDVVFVDLPSAGLGVSVGQTVGSVESVKTVSDIYSPVAGELLETNPKLGGQSELVNSDPYGEGWMLKVKLSGTPEGLMSPADYSSSLD